MKQTACLVLCTLIPGLAVAQGLGSTRPAGSGTPAPSGKGHPSPQVPLAAGPSLSGLIVALGMGYGVGIGDLYAPPSLDSPFPNSDTLAPNLSGNVSGQLPISIGLGYRPRSFVSFGLAVGLARIFVKDCVSTCTSNNRRFGAELRFHIIPERQFSPWMSLGVGYERYLLQRGNPDEGYSRKTNLAGYDLDLQVGGSIRVTRMLTIGPYVGLRIGTYGHFGFSSTCRGCSDDEFEIPDASQATHEWLVIGAHGAFTLPMR